ncbi:MAG: hypothetical protein RKP20_04230 [Candidatus Competibacter sp.]|nr:hypothetical protein [Candidatus Competibacter sp.]
MSTWQLINAVVLVGVAAVLAAVGWLAVRIILGQKQRIEEQLQAARQAAAEKAAAEKAAAEKAAADKVAIARAAAERLSARRAAVEKAAAERAAIEKAAVEQAIAEWAAAEQAEADRVQLRRTTEERREAEEVEARMRAVEEAISEWIEAEREGSRLAATETVPGKPAQKTYTRTEAIHQQVRLHAELVDKEVQELEYIKNRIQVGVDFLPIEFRQAIDDWKKGMAFRRSTFEDLKLKFRYKAYSVEDGYELLYMYNAWMVQQRQKLRVFIRLLGTDVDRAESILAAIEQAERSEREKYLEMDVDVIYALHNIRSILEKLIGMETILKELEAVCRKRSEQIISPSWEAKGSL